MSETDINAEGFPEKGDRLFVEAHFVMGGPMVSDTAERFYRLPRAFKTSGDLLLEQALTSDVDRKNLTYPALYCYRQALELFLKYLVHTHGSDEMKRTHDLLLLWEQFEALTQSTTIIREEAFNSAKCLVQELHCADPKSDGFRFPFDVKGVPFPQADKILDIENFRRVMGSLMHYLECLDLELTYGSGTQA